MLRLEIKNYNTILTGKQQKSGKSLSSDKADKGEYDTDEEILTSEQGRTIEQAEFTYSSLGKALEKQTKTIEDQRR